MPSSFALPERIGGFVAAPVAKGGKVTLVVRESLTSLDGIALTWRLEGLHTAIFANIPGIPAPSAIDSLLVIISPTLQGTAYINEIAPKAEVTVDGPVQAGQPVLVRDVKTISSLDLGVSVPNDHAVIVVRSFGWRRSLFYDISQLHEPTVPRSYDLKAELGRQAYTLLTGTFDSTQSIQPNSAQIVLMKAGLQSLRDLMTAKSEDESKYQEVLAANPWIFAGHYSTLDRHTKLDDETIPDFTAPRRHDGMLDIIELKHPFLPLFQRDGQFASGFNNAWNQTERYLTFARDQKAYLWSQKQLAFENPRGVLIIGVSPSQAEQRAIQQKQAHNSAITVYTYDQVIALGEAMISLASSGTLTSS